MRITNIDLEILFFKYVIEQLKVLNEELAKDNAKFEGGGKNEPSVTIR